jgi:hypothetical protein
VPLSAIVESTSELSPNQPQASISGYAKAPNTS